MARAGARFHRSRGASRPQKGERADQRIYLHVLKPKPGEPIVFDASMSWMPFLFGKTEPLKLTEETDVLELELPKTALMSRSTRSSFFIPSRARKVGDGMSEPAEVHAALVDRLDERPDGEP